MAMESDIGILDKVMPINNTVLRRLNISTLKKDLRS